MVEGKMISVVIPVYNEEESLPRLIDRLRPVMEGLKRPYEVVFVETGAATGAWSS